jgi:gas vesicle protein
MPHILAGDKPMGKVLMFMGGVIAGAIIGGAVTLLMTPQSGDSLRGQARQRYQDALEAGRKAADERKQQLVSEYEAMKRGEVQIFPKD